ncbi:class A beta-lactamase-related serine hydrolase [Alteromonas sediminis]|uniref:Class A beta-lactamase-related serine hydrolase n=1 Tax=Alteromonas sediminis TaxID=2259342 RepID=A0A3N5Y2B5_9ALTE|nr:class A beta-lactamase-related serine hydrolase [Alteromonas sediminis]
MGGATAQTSAIPSWFKNYERYVSEQARRYNIPGYALVFYQKGQSPIVVTYGRTHRGGKRVSPDTVFRLASVSKTFTGVLMAKWTTGHSLSWETPVSDMLKDQDWSKSKFANMTLADIVGQSSGFMPNAYDNLIEADYTLKRVLDDMADLDLLCDPGVCYTYQNALFGVISDYFFYEDTSYHREMHELVFAPLAMDTASVGKAGLQSSKSWARPHAAVTRSRWREVQVDSNYYRFAPAAGVNASINDMTSYLQALLGEVPNVVSTDIVNLITTPRVTTTREKYRRGWRPHIKSAHYGLGWRIYDFNGHTLNYHGGWVRGYRADVAFSQEHGVGFAMLMNAESNMINSATAEFWKRYFDNLPAED